MKIMYIVHSCVMGGATISFKYLLEGMVLNNVEAIIIYPRASEGEEYFVKIFESIGCKCIGLDVAVSYTIKRLNLIKFLISPLHIAIKRKKFYNQLINIAKEIKPDIIHTNTGVIREGCLLAKKISIPHIWHLREFQTKDFNMIILPSKSSFIHLLNNSYSICITKEIQTYFKQLKNNKSKVIYNPAMSKSDILDSRKKENSFLVANRISKEKGIENILYAFSQFSKYNSDYILKIAGFGNEKYIEYLKKICLKLNIEQKVFFLGFTNDVPKLMTEAKALIVASYNEGFGRMTAEANMLGTIVIGRNSAGTKEIIELTKGGFLFNDNLELLRYMFKVANMNTTNLYDTMLESKKIAINEFNNDDYIKKVLNYYNHVIVSSKKG